MAITKRLRFEIIRRDGVNNFLDAGLTINDLVALIEVAMTKSTTTAWRYFCGCAWRTVSDSQQAALAIVGGA